MARTSQGGAYEARGNIYLRATVAPGERRAAPLAWVTAEQWARHDVKASPCPCVACERGRVVQELVNRYRAGGADLEMLEGLVKQGATGNLTKLSVEVDAFCQTKKLVPTDASALDIARLQLIEARHLCATVFDEEMVTPVVVLQVAALIRRNRRRSA